jgi:hypothetical protein
VEKIDAKLGPEGEGRTSHRGRGGGAMRAWGGGGRAAGGGGSPPERKAREEREWTVVWRRETDQARDGRETRETVRKKIRFCFIYFSLAISCSYILVLELLFSYILIPRTYISSHF